MSHTTTLDTITIKEERAIRAAVEKLGLAGVPITLLEDAVPRMYYDRQEAEVGKCDFVLKLGGSRYDVGLKLNANSGQYDVYYDAWGSDVSNVIGARDKAGNSCPLPETQDEKDQWALGRFSQMYALEAARMSAEDNGYFVQDTILQEDGTVQLVLAA